MRDLVLVGMLGLIPAGCFLKTPHQEAGFRGGYNDFEVQPNVHFVSWEGNGFTPRDEVVAGWHQRAAEICGGRSHYKIMAQDTETHRTESYNATATTDGDTTTVTVSPGLTISKSRAEGYVRCEAPSPREAEPSFASARDPSMWCFAGSLSNGTPTGICQAELDACVAMIDKAIAVGMQAGPVCDRLSAVTCFGATSDVDGTRRVTCFPTPSICEREQGLMGTTTGWREVSGCASPGGEPLGTLAAAQDRETACDGGDVNVCLKLAGEHYEAGKVRRSIVFTSKACRAGHSPSCVHVAQALETGDGIEADPKKAAVLYKAACKLGDDAACEGFARLRSSEDSGTAVDQPPAAPAAPRFVAGECITREAFPAGHPQAGQPDGYVWLVSRVADGHYYSLGWQGNGWGNEVRFRVGHFEGQDYVEAECPRVRPNPS